MNFNSVAKKQNNSIIMLSEQIRQTRVWFKLDC